MPGFCLAGTLYVKAAFYQLGLMPRPKMSSLYHVHIADIHGHSRKLKTSILDMIEFTNSLTVSISCDENSCMDRSTFKVASTRRHFKRSASSTAVSNASNYIGSVDANGKAHGYGSCIWPDGRWGLGQWQHGDLFGWAGLFFKDGSVLIGEWVNGICHGFGMFMSPDGVVQSGVWRQGQCVIYDH